MSTLSPKDQPEYLIETKPKGMMQKIALFSSYISFILAGVSGLFLYLKTQELGVSDPITASFLASFFFFIFTGVPLMIMAKANLPNFKFDNSKSDAE